MEAWSQTVTKASILKTINKDIQGDSRLAKSAAILEHSQIALRNHLCVNDIFVMQKKKLRNNTFKTEMDVSFVGEVGTRSLGVWARQLVTHKRDDNSVVRNIPDGFYQSNDGTGKIYKLPKELLKLQQRSLNKSTKN